MKALAGMVIGLALMLNACHKPPMTPVFNTLDGNPPVIIAHRGASGYLPEHTLEGAIRAMELGADFIEPDLVLTRDGILVVRHDNYLSTTTDVSAHPEFADRKRFHPLLGREDWFIEDFTWEEISTLRARQPFAGRSLEFDGRYKIPSLDELAALVAAEAARSGRSIGLYPETKHPAYFASIGLKFEASLLEILKRYGFGPDGLPVFIQSFETDILKSLSHKTEIPLIMLLGPESEFSFEHIATDDQGLGPSKAMLVDEHGEDSGFIQRAHDLGLKVHPWTFRSDSLPDAFAEPEEEFALFYGLGIDGLFTDFTDHALAAREAYK